MTTLGWAGVGLLVVAGLAIVVEGVVAALWGMAVAKRALTLTERLETERRLIEADLEKLRLASGGDSAIVAAISAVLRWLGHQFTIALLGSYRRRRLLR